MNENYRKALSYAWKCCPPLYRDITHTAYIRHYNRHGTNLFEQNLFLVLTYVKNVWFNEIREGQYMKDGVYYKRQYYSIEDDFIDEPGTITLQTGGVPPDRELMSKEFCEELFSRVDNYRSGHKSSLDPKVLRKFLDLLALEYKSTEICKEMNISHQTLYFYKKKLQTIIKQMDEIKSPFNGSQNIMKAKVTRKNYEVHKDDKYSGFVYDPDRGCDSNEFYQELINDAGEFLLIREKGD